MLKSPCNVTDFDKSSQLEKRCIGHEDNVKTVNRAITGSFSEKVSDVFQNGYSPSSEQCTNLHISATINVEYNIQPVSSCQSNKLYSRKSVSAPYKCEANGIGYEAFEKHMKSNSTPQKRKSIERDDSDPPEKRCIIHQNVIVNMNNNNKNYHVSNNFGSASSFVIQPIPYVLRDKELYVSMRTLNEKVFSVYAKYLTREVIECFDFDETNMTESEVEYFNELSRKHPEYFSGCPFTTLDKVLSSGSFLALLEFLEFCYDILVTKTVTVAKEKCGFLKITQTNVVPYVWFKSKKYLPLFYFESEDQCLNEMAVEISGPHLAYLRLCCKMQKIRKDFFNEKTCKVICLDNIAKFCPQDSQFEDEWPINICPGLLTVEAAPSQDTTTTTVKNAEQVSLVNNDTVQQTPIGKTGLLESTSTDASLILKVEEDQKLLDSNATNITSVNNVSVRSHTNKSQIDCSQENYASTETSFNYSELLKSYNELNKNPNYIAYQKDKSITMSVNQWQKKPFCSNDSETSNNRLLSPLSYQADRTNDYQNYRTNQSDTTNNRLPITYNLNNNHTSCNPRNHKKTDILNGNNGLYKATEATRLNIPVQYNVDTTNNINYTLPHPEILKRDNSDMNPNRSINSAVYNYYSTHQPENMHEDTFEKAIQMVSNNTPINIPWPNKLPPLDHDSQWLAQKRGGSHNGGSSSNASHMSNNSMLKPVPDNNVTNNIGTHQPKHLHRNIPQSATERLTNTNNSPLPNIPPVAYHDSQRLAQICRRSYSGGSRSNASHPSNNSMHKPVPDNNVTNNINTHQPEHLHRNIPQSATERLTNTNTPPLPNKSPAAYQDSQRLAQIRRRSHNDGSRSNASHPSNSSMFKPVPDNNVTNNISTHQPEYWRQNVLQSAAERLTNTKTPPNNPPSVDTPPGNNRASKPRHVQIADPGTEHAAGYKCCSCKVQNSLLLPCVNMHPYVCSKHLIPVDEIRNNFYKWIPLTTFYTVLRNIGFDLYKPNTHQTTCLLRIYTRKRSISLCIVLEVYNEFSFLLNYLNSDKSKYLTCS